MQMNQQDIDAIVAQIQESGNVRSHSDMPWVTEDGVYEHQEHLNRVFVWNGFCYFRVTKSWIENGDHSHRLDEWMKAPWGTYPDLPRKPPKRAVA